MIPQYTESHKCNSWANCCVSVYLLFYQRDRINMLACDRSNNFDSFNSTAWQCVASTVTAAGSNITNNNNKTLDVMHYLPARQISVCDMMFINNFSKLSFSSPTSRWAVRQSETMVEIVISTHPQGRLQRQESIVVGTHGRSGCY